MTNTQASPWLLLIPQLPAKPAYLRVKVWRRLQAIGAAPLKNAVHALPNREDTRALFEELHREITENGGEALIPAMDPPAPIILKRRLAWRALKISPAKSQNCKTEMEMITSTQTYRTGIIIPFNLNWMPARVMIKMSDVMVMFIPRSFPDARWL